MRIQRLRSVDSWSDLESANDDQIRCSTEGGHCRIKTEFHIWKRRARLPADAQNEESSSANGKHKPIQRRLLTCAMNSAKLQASPSDFDTDDWDWQENAQELHSPAAAAAVNEEPPPAVHSPKHHSSSAPVIETVQTDDSDLLYPPVSPLPLSPRFRPSPRRNAEPAAAAAPPSPKPEQIDAELEQVRQQSAQRRLEFQTTVHDLQCRLASLTAKAAEEDLERQAALRNLYQHHVDAPLQDLLERLWLESSAGKHDSQTWMHAEQRATQVEARLTTALHVHLADAERQHVVAIQTEVARLVKEIKQAQSWSMKRQGDMVRRLDHLAAIMARRYQEERAARRAAVEQCADNLREHDEIDQQRAQDYLDEIRRLRAQVAEERAERQAQDERIRQRIHRATAHLKRCLLEYVGGPLEEEAIVPR